MPTTFPALNLTYFDFGGRAEATRVTLFMGSVPFVDERLSQAQFAARKAQFPYHKVPVLTVDGEPVAESQGILRYAARLSGMYPVNDPMAALLVDELLASFDEFFETIFQASFNERDAEKKKSMRKALLAGPLPKALRQLEARLQHIATYPFFHQETDKIYVHEVIVWDYVVMFKSGFLDHIPLDTTDAYPVMTDMYTRVAAHPKVQQWLAKKENKPPAKIKLTYFDRPARAEQIRLAFHIGGIAFEDERLSQQEFATRKDEFPFGLLPVLTVDGVVVAQSFAILRYAGTLAGLYPVDDPLKAIKIDEVLGHTEELYQAIGQYFAAAESSDPETLRKLCDTQANEFFPLWLDTLEKRVAQWKQQQHGHSGDASTAITIADLAIHSAVQFLQSGFLSHVPLTVVDKYTSLVEVANAVASHPRVVDWYASTRTSKAQ